MYILVYLLLSYAVGVLSWEYDVAPYALILAFAFVIFDCIRNKRLMFGAAVILIFLFAVVNCNYNSKSVLTQYINNNIAFVAEIKGLKKSGGESAYDSYDASVYSVNGKILSSSENTIIYVKENKVLHAGDRVTGEGDVADILFGRNRFLFNYKNYLRGLGVRAVIFTDECEIAGTGSSLYAFSERFKNYAENIFCKYMEQINAGVVLSMILGDRSYLNESVYEDAKASGLAHIFAVSGLHVGILYVAMLNFLRFIGFGRRKSWIITWSLLWGYGLLIGLPVSVFRTLVMFTMLCGSEVLYRRYNSLNSIAFAGLILLVVNPFWLFDTGFQLSFLSALGLILYSRLVYPHISFMLPVGRTVCMYIFLQIFTLPVVAYYFNYIPVAGILYNLLLIPVFTFILIAGFVLLGVGWLGGGAVVLCFTAYNGLLSLVRFVLGLELIGKFGGFTIASPDIVMTAIYYIMLTYVLFTVNCGPLRFKYAGGAVILLYVVLTYIVVPAYDVSLKFSIVDAGQGLFTVMSHRGMNFVFDCGSLSDEFGYYTAVPYLVKSGIGKIDSIFISHWDSDHCSGAVDISDNFEVKYLFAPEDNCDIINDTVVLHAGNYVKPFGYMNISVLWPQEGFEVDSKNNGSLVMRVVFNDVVILLPGDVESGTEGMLVGELGDVDILVVPHHGSKSSSTEAFVSETSPDYAVLSYGRNNYGIPDAGVIQRYSGVGSTVFSTYEDGEINFVIKGDDIYYSCYGGRQSDNWYGLGFEWILPKCVLLVVLAAWFYLSVQRIDREENLYELQRFNEGDF